MRTDRDISAALPARIALLGFGEAGSALAEGWHDARPGLTLAAYDLKTESSENEIAAAMWDRYGIHGVSGADSPDAALAGAEAVFSLVTADAAQAAARAAAAAIAPGAFYFDCNSCAPETKRASAALIEAAGGRYVDTAIMSPIRPKLHRAPLLVSGPHAAEGAALLTALDMSARALTGDVGHASSVKMLRSVMIKGIEALTLESLLAARRAGVADEVIASLDASMPGWDWAARAAYNMERTTTHGARRAAEMREVARSVADLGLPPRMAEATVAWQADMGALGIDPGDMDFEHRADAILAALNTTNRRTSDDEEGI